VALGFSVHTGWAAMTAVSGDLGSAVVLERRRVTMIDSTERVHPRFVFHAARLLPPAEARGFVETCTGLARAGALRAMQTAVEALHARGCDAAACSIIVGNRPLTATLESILKSHSLVHTAEGALFRDALRAASLALGLPVVEVRAGELRARSGEALRCSAQQLEERLVSIGRLAGRPWARDQQDACLAALIALAT
jgi:hypothetical protein